MTRKSCAINTETEQKIQNVSFDDNWTSAIEQKREKMRYFKFIHIGGNDEWTSHCGSELRVPDYKHE